MKYPTSCPQCRTTKRKCIRDASHQNSACLACQSRCIECSGPWLQPNPRPKLLREKPPQDLSATSDAEHLPLPNTNSNEIRQFIRHYFHFIHDRPHSLFHQQSLWNALERGSLPESLLSAICALGCRFSTSTNHRSLTKSFMSKSRRLFAHQLEDISVSNIQTCILLANSYAAEQDHRLEALYFGIANRMAYVLELHKGVRGESPILRETNCRVWWSLVMADRWCPPALGIPREITSFDPTLRMPMDESAFQDLRIDKDDLQPHQGDGIWAYKVSLVDIFALVQDLNLSLLDNDADRVRNDARVDELADRLQAWYDSLPQHLVMNDRNLDAYRNKGHGGTFVALHLGYHHYSTLLYFQYLDIGRQPSIRTLTCADKCRFHGLAYSRLLNMARALGDCHVVYLTVAHMTMVSSLVLLHLLLFGNDEAVQIARIQLTRNFEVFIDLAKYWSCVDRMKEKLFIFQRACLQSSVPETYATGRWLIRFLLEYALPLNEDEGTPNTVLSSGALYIDSSVPFERRKLLDEALDDLRA